MNNLTSPLALLLLAAALAGGVAWLAYFYLQQREESMKLEIAAKGRKNVTPKENVVVPNKNSDINTVLNSNNFVSRPMEEDLIYPDTILAKDFSAMEGQKLARAVMKGRPVRITDLQMPEVNDVSAILPPGMRAMTIEIDNLNSIAQTLRPNHHVDIFLLNKAPKPNSGGAEVDDKMLEQATLFMQDMVVLATGKEFQEVSTDPDRAAKMVRPGEVQGAREKGFDSITLLVKPAEAARLMAGQKMGSYRVVLRGNKDRDELAMRPLRAALTTGLTPLFASSADATGYDVAYGKALVETTALYTKIEVLNPTPAAMSDFGRTRLDGVSGKELPNDTLAYRTTTPGSNSKISVQDANILHLRVTYCARLIVPVIDRILYSTVNALTPMNAGLAASGMSNPFGTGDEPLVPSCVTSLIGGRRIQIQSEAFIRMQSPFYNSNL